MKALFMLGFLLLAFPGWAQNISYFDLTEDRLVGGKALGDVMHIPEICIDDTFSLKLYTQFGWLEGEQFHTQSVPETGRYDTTISNALTSLAANPRGDLTPAELTTLQGALPLLTCAICWVRLNALEAAATEAEKEQPGSGKDWSASLVVARKNL